jgi:hypothetical protein
MEKEGPDKRRRLLSCYVSRRVIVIVMIGCKRDASVSVKSECSSNKFTSPSLSYECFRVKMLVLAKVAQGGKGRSRLRDCEKFGGKSI